jgi:DNA-binding response OmpR family regulator
VLKVPYAIFIRMFKMIKTNILVIDDNAELRNMVRVSLEQNGHSVFNASNGQEGLHLLRAKKVDTILLDLTLPDVDGLSLIAEIRKLTDAPVIVISGKGAMVDKVVGLEMGADDYLGKPFQVEELNARIKANIRRYKGTGDTHKSVQQFPHERVRFSGLMLDEGKFQIFDASGNSCGLTAMEFQLLQALVKNPNCVMSRAQILDTIRADNPHINDRAIDIQVARIRKKIGDAPKDPQIIKTVRGIGYMLACDTEVVEG